MLAYGLAAVIIIQVGLISESISTCDCHHFVKTGVTRTKMEAAGSITVRVKDGGLKCGDLDVQCNYGDKVRQLKQMISAKSPLHPVRFCVWNSNNVV